MLDLLMNPLKTGVMFVAPGRIMDPGVMRVPQHGHDHVSRLRADMGLDGLEAGSAPTLRPSWSFRQLLEQLGGFAGRRRPAHT
ncbi:MAG TPA: hypothetical protein VED46_01125 [Alphaproteobacteria bacterium]|nr:hypothetical protein [Alphaproteobacteria bacterium]